MARYELGEGNIFMLHAKADSGPGGPWHVPTPGSEGQSPTAEGYVAECGAVISTSDVEVIRLPFAIGEMPRPNRICKACKL